MDAVAAGNHSPDGLAGFRIHPKRLVLHALLHLETADWFRSIGRFVNVNWHGDFTPQPAIALSGGPVSCWRLGRIPSPRCETRPVYRCVRRYARQKSRVEPGANSKANARSG